MCIFGCRIDVPAYPDCSNVFDHSMEMSDMLIEENEVEITDCQARAKYRSGSIYGIFSLHVNRQMLSMRSPVKLF